MLFLVMTLCSVV